MEIPEDPDDEVRWEFVDMQRSTIWGILEQSSTLATLTTGGTNCLVVGLATRV